MAVSYRKGYEQGLWYEIKTLEDIIALKEGKNEDCEFEKKLLKSWLKYSRSLGATNRNLGGSNGKQVSCCPDKT